MARLTTHTSCINTTYLKGPARGSVPKDKVPFSAAFPEYSPVDYTAPSVLAGPVWADKDIKAGVKHDMKFNTLDGKVNRVSHYGEYKVVDGMPVNPVGRTGIKGRGLLGKWGPNHAADPVVTRWKRDEKGAPVKVSGKGVLEFVGIKRRDTGEWAIPGGMVEAGDSVSATLRKEFGEEALAALDMPKAEQERVMKLTKQLFSGSGTTLYRGYVDDPRNTDNAWMETVAVNFHDTSGDLFSSFKLKAGDDAGAVSWITASSKLPMYASHANFVKCAVEKLGGDW